MAVRDIDYSEQIDPAKTYTANTITQWERNMIDSKVPTKMNMTIASVNEAVEYWLKEQVFQSEVEIEKISFNEREHFTITFKRSSEAE